MTQNITFLNIADVVWGVMQFNAENYFEEKVNNVLPKVKGKQRHAATSCTSQYIHNWLQSLLTDFR